MQVHSAGVADRDKETPPTGDHVRPESRRSWATPLRSCTGLPLESGGRSIRSRQSVSGRFQVLPQRWVVERMFARQGWHWRLGKDY